jgi:hypothetical protein
MKKYASLITLLAMASTSFGIIYSEFKSWNHVADESSDIVVARCTATPYYTPPGAPPKPTWIIDNVTQSDIEVVSVLKGSTKPALSHMASWYRPYQGQLFLVFANYTTYGTNSSYNAIEEYRVVPISRDFQMSELNGKTLGQQVQCVLAARVKDLAQELAQENEEKKRIEEGIKSGTLTNLPAGTQQK